jgi:hypothetical protein
MSLSAGRKSQSFAVPSLGPMPLRIATNASTQIADAEQSPWMRLNSDVFEPAFTGSQDSVCWVNIAELLRQVK